MLALNEYLAKEPFPLAVVHEAIMDFCRGRPDSCVVGVHALNRHTHAPRMTQDVDIMAEEPERVAEELASFLGQRRGEKTLGYRVYQSRTEARGGNRHLADVRQLDVPREHVVVTDGVQYTDAKLTLAMKAAAAAARSNQVKRLQDIADLARLIVVMPDFAAEHLDPIWEQLHALPGARDVFEKVRNFGDLRPETDDDSFY